MLLIHRLTVDPTLPTIIRETAPSGQGCSLASLWSSTSSGSPHAKMQGKALSDRDLCRVTVQSVTRAATFLRRIALPNLFKLGYATMPEEGQPASPARWIAGYILAYGCRM